MKLLLRELVVILHVLQGSGLPGLFWTMRGNWVGNVQSAGPARGVFAETNLTGRGKLFRALASAPADGRV